MSGHSKWSSIKHKKAIKDQKRGKVFRDLSKVIECIAELFGCGPRRMSESRKVRCNEVIFLGERGL